MGWAPLWFPIAPTGQYPIMSTSKKAKNRIDRLAGKAKQTLGEVTGDARLRSEGRADQVKARVKITGERLKDAVRGR